MIPAGSLWDRRVRDCFEKLMKATGFLFRKKKKKVNLYIPLQRTFTWTSAKGSLIGAPCKGAKATQMLLCFALWFSSGGDIIYAVLQMEKLRFRGVTLTACLVLEGVTGLVSWEFPNYFSSCMVERSYPTPAPPVSLSRREGYEELVVGGLTPRGWSFRPNHL